MGRAELAGKRVLVVGLARSGMAAAEVLWGVGADVVGFDRNEALETGRLVRTRCRSPPRTGGGDAATGDRSRCEEPGSAGPDAVGRGRPRARHPRLERDRARLAPARQSDPRRHRHERQDHDERASRRDVPRRRPARRGRGKRRAAAHVARRPGHARLLGSSASSRPFSSRTHTRWSRASACS